MRFWNLFSRKNTTVGDMNEIMRGYVTHTRSGTSVTAESAMRCSAVYSCIAVLSESIAQLPLMLYERKSDGSRVRKTDHPLYDILHNAPNEWMTSFEFWEHMTANCALRGNAYAFINRGVGGKVLELFPLDTGKVKVTRSTDGDLSYTIPDGKTERTVGSESILHLRYRTLDGVTGISPITYNRETVGLAIAATEHGAEVFGSGAMVAGTLTVQGTLSDEARQRLKTAWNDNYHGNGKKLQTAVLDGGAKWEKMSLSAEDAQYIETRKLQRSEIAAIFRVPPHLIGDLEKATFSNIEHQSIEFVRSSLVPWLRRFEQALARDLLTEQERKTLYPEFLVEGMLRGDSQSRAQFYKELFATGSITANEIRSLENMERIGTQGDARYVPANLMPLGSSGPNGDKTNA